MVSAHFEGVDELVHSALAAAVQYEPAGHGTHSPWSFGECVPSGQRVGLLSMVKVAVASAIVGVFGWQMVPTQLEHRLHPGSPIFHT